MGSIIVVATPTFLLNQLFSINIKQALCSRGSPKHIPNVLADLADAAIFKVCDILGCTFLIPQNVYHKTIHTTWIVNINADVYNAGTIKVNINGL